MDEIKEAREALKDRLREYVEQITDRSAGGLYVCPLCGSGTGPNGTGAFDVTKKSNGLKWTCYSCNQHGDLYDLIGYHECITDPVEQVRRAMDIFGYVYRNQPRTERKHTHTDTHTHTHTAGEAEQTDYTDFYREAHRHIAETDYLTRRGISEATAKRFLLGYVPDWKYPGKPNVPATPRLIIPTSRTSYSARAVSEADENYRYLKVGSVHLLNVKALSEAETPVFIVEGEIDAISIAEVGGEAVAVGGTSGCNQLLKIVAVTPPKKPLIIALDNDEPGKKAASELCDGLTKQGVPFTVCNPAGEYKDANEALQRNRGALEVAVAQAISEAETLEDEAEALKKEAYLATSTAHYLQGFINGIQESVDTPYIPTGFPELDNVLDGGLYEGLYIAGAISSLGKTTLICQIADQIAQTGKDVLIISLEMARSELIAKSISRHTIQQVIATKGNFRNAKTARGITTGKRYTGYSKDEMTLISDAMKAYGEYAEHLYIIEGVGDVGAEQVREAVVNHIRYTGNVPVVVIDYLQILAPYSERATDKQNTDKAVMELKRISRDYKTPVIGISSLNRMNYSNKISMEAFKESGAIEYSSDVLIGLQLKGAGKKEFDVDRAKAKDPREIELVILKNRNGRTGVKVDFQYYPMFNYFVEGAEMA